MTDPWASTRYNDSTCGSSITTTSSGETMCVTTWVNSPFIPDDDEVIQIPSVWFDDLAPQHIEVIYFPDVEKKFNRSGKRGRQDASI